MHCKYCIKEKLKEFSLKNSFFYFPNQVFYNVNFLFPI